MKGNKRVHIPQVTMMRDVTVKGFKGMQMGSLIGRWEN